MTVRNYKHSVVCFLFFFIHVLPHANAQIATASPPPPLFEPSPEIGPNFNPTMAIVMVVIISVFFLIGFFSVSIRQCLERRFPRENNPDPYTVFLRGTDQWPRRASRGLDASVINTFPAFLYHSVKGLKIGRGSLECAVCLNEFEDDETLRLLPKCSHVFHIDCIDAWLASHTTCPVCRANLVPEPGENASCVVPIFNSGCDSGEPEPSSDHMEEVSQSERRSYTESPDVNLTNKNRPPRSRSTGQKLGGLFPRSHSTGHSLVQPGENYERFTLRLPEEVRNQLVTSTLSRSKSCVAFPSVRSSRRGFRSGSGGFGRGRNNPFYERFDRPSRSGHWPFFYRTGSLRPAKPTGGGVEVTCTPFKFVKSSSDRILIRDDNDGERSFDRLRNDSQV